jgi:hypothetical protein
MMKGRCYFVKPLPSCPSVAPCIMLSQYIYIYRMTTTIVRWCFPDGTQYIFFQCTYCSGTTCFGSPVTMESKRLTRLSALHRILVKYNNVNGELSKHERLKGKSCNTLSIKGMNDQVLPDQDIHGGGNLRMNASSKSEFNFLYFPDLLPSYFIHVTY